MQRNPETVKITAISKSNKNIKAECKVTVYKKGKTVHKGTYKKTKWTIDSNGLLEVKGKGEFYQDLNDEIDDEMADTPDWCYYDKKIKSARIELAGAKNLSYMFYGLENLSNIDFSKFDTSSATSMAEMFSHCESLESLDLSNFHTSKVTDMAAMFSYCYNLKNLDLTNLDTSSLRYICRGVYDEDRSIGMFTGCRSLTALNLSKFNVSKVVNMQNLFEGCSSLTKLDLSNWNTSKVFYMGEMFRGCSSLTKVNLSNWNTSEVTDMRAVFEECKNLTTLDLGNFNTEEAIYMERMFSGCSKLKTLNLKHFNTSNVTNMEEMFSGCNELESLDISNFDISSVENMTGFFMDCTKLTKIKSPKKSGEHTALLPENVWLDNTGEIYIKLPQNVTQSAILTKQEYNGPVATPPAIEGNIIYGGAYQNTTWTIDKNGLLEVKGNRRYVLSV